MNTVNNIANVWHHIHSTFMNWGSEFSSMYVFTIIAPFFSL